MSVTTEEELKIENLIVELAKLLDEEYNVKAEFYGVLVEAIGRRVELIEEQGLTEGKHEK